MTPKQCDAQWEWYAQRFIRFLQGVVAGEIVLIAMKAFGWHF